MISPSAHGCRSLASQLMRKHIAGKWRVSAGCPPSSQLVLWVPLRTEWPEAPLLRRVVDPGRSHAHEIGALKIELQAEPHGPGFSSGEASWGHIKDAAEATHAPSAAARAQRPHEEELFPQSGLERGHAGSAFRTGPFVIFGVRRGWRRSPPEPATAKVHETERDAEPKPTSGTCAGEPCLPFRKRRFFGELPSPAHGEETRENRQASLALRKLFQLSFPQDPRTASEGSASGELFWQNSTRATGQHWCRKRHRQWVEPST